MKEKDEKKRKDVARHVTGLLTGSHNGTTNEVENIIL